jgi:hypothetical protein
VQHGQHGIVPTSENYAYADLERKKERKKGRKGRKKERKKVTYCFKDHNFAPLSEILSS